MEPNLRRRRFIISLSALSISLAGCIGSDSNPGGDGGSGGGTAEPIDSDNDGIPDIDDDYPNDPSRRFQIGHIDDRRNLEEDQWRTYSFELNESGVLSYDFVVRDGPAIDVIVMDESEYTYFENDERWQYYASLSNLDSTGGSVEENIPAGDFMLIFDNSNKGEARPPTNFSNDVISVEFEIELAV